MNQPPPSLWPHPPDKPVPTADSWWRRLWLASHTAPTPPGAPIGRRFAPWRAVASLVAASLALCTVCSCALVFAAVTHPVPQQVTIVVTATATDTPTPSLPPTATPRPTVTPKPTMPPAPGPVRTASLGGTQSAFTAAYGDPAMNDTTPYYIITLPDGFPGDVELSDIEAGSDGNDRVDILTVQPEDASAWTAADAAAVTSRFIPRDSHYVRDIADPTVGTIHVYQSAGLARSFPASTFTDSGNGATLPPGTLGVACDNPAQTGCTITVGT